MSNVFSFSGDSVAQSYNDVLVPLMFEPWGIRLVEEHAPWDGLRILDLATGTGIVARLLADQVGSDGSVVAADINPEMLELARQRCADLENTVTFLESPAHPLDLPDESVDAVVCQQGFQFFPDRDAAAHEIHRVLRPGGPVVATTWRPIAECGFFGVICTALERIDEKEIGDLMRTPFDFMPEDELGLHFEDAGFDDVQITQQEKDAVFPGGVEQVVQTTYNTPIGPKLRALPPEKQDAYRAAFVELLRPHTQNGATATTLTSNRLTARKPA
jgi:ubiquinone/menaquinone biosynthesis C-methylase UbiE